MMHSTLKDRCKALVNLDRAQRHEQDTQARYTSERFNTDTWRQRFDDWVWAQVGVQDARDHIRYVYAKPLARPHHRESIITMLIKSIIASFVARLERQHRSKLAAKSRVLFYQNTIRR